MSNKIIEYLNKSFINYHDTINNNDIIIKNRFDNWDEMSDNVFNRDYTSRSGQTIDE